MGFFSFSKKTQFQYYISIRKHEMNKNMNDSCYLCFILTLKKQYFSTTTIATNTCHTFITSRTDVLSFSHIQYFSAYTQTIDFAVKTSA